MENEFLFPDEIAEILRSAPSGSVVTVQGVLSVKVSDYPVNYDGIIGTEHNYIVTRSRSGLWFVYEQTLVNEIYDAIESGSLVTINDQDILTM